MAGTSIDTSGLDRILTLEIARVTERAAVAAAQASAAGETRRRRIRPPSDAMRLWIQPASYRLRRSDRQEGGQRARGAHALYRRGSSGAIAKAPSVDIALRSARRQRPSAPKEPCTQFRSRVIAMPQKMAACSTRQTVSNEWTRLAIGSITAAIRPTRCRLMPVRPRISTARSPAPEGVHVSPGQQPVFLDRPRHARLIDG